LWDTHDCPLSSLVRKRLRRLGFGSGKKALDIKNTGDIIVAEFNCVWSDEPAVPPAMPADGSIPGETVNGERVRAVQGSGPFVPQAAGHILASLAVRHVLAR
jgi:tRNA A37 threonylcarbamoyladenosine dehydratase